MRATYVTDARYMCYKCALHMSQMRVKYNTACYTITQYKTFLLAILGQQRSMSKQNRLITCRVGHNHIYIYTRYFGREITKYTVIYGVYTRYFWQGNHQVYGVYVRFWPTLMTCEKQWAAALRAWW